jgi:hypothetical protein
MMKVIILAASFYFTLTHSSRAIAGPGLRHSPGISEVKYMTSPAFRVWPPLPTRTCNLPDNT